VEKVDSSAKQEKDVGGAAREKDDGDASSKDMGVVGVGLEEMVVRGAGSVESEDGGYRGGVTTKEKEDCEKLPCGNVCDGKGFKELTRRRMGTRTLLEATPTNFSLAN